MARLMFLISKGILKELPVVVLIRGGRVVQGEVDPRDHHLQMIDVRMKMSLNPKLTQLTFRKLQF